MAFECSVGQAETARRLRATLRADRLPHALLFTGAEGTGRLAFAHDLARVLLCSSPPGPDDYCGECEDCRLAAAGRHPDYHESGVPDDRQFLPIAAVRDVQTLAAMKPVRAAGRVFVVRDVDRITIEAANCFLKILEEPPGNSVFVLIASSLRRIPETIVSRCRIVRFASLPPDELGALLEQEGLAPEDARWLARRAWGSPGLARKLAQAGLHGLNRKLREEASAPTLADNFRLADLLNGCAAEAGGKGAAARAALQDLLECLAALYRDMAVLAACGKSADLANADLPGSSGPDASPEAFLARAELVIETLERIGANANSRLALDRLFTRLGMLSPA